MGTAMSAAMSVALMMVLVVILACDPYTPPPPIPIQIRGL